MPNTLTRPERFYLSGEKCVSQSVSRPAVEKIQWKQSYFNDIKRFCDHDLEVSTPIFQHDTPPHDDAPPYDGWLQKD